ncbi:SET domain-containing protein-lysine N-methyltransferase [Fictibacillus phosphorivorans]|uniref:SET domain-containing protein-lysine N-methyltransferase n=1 Tax=Fictibacillus phosphorivorans TaxID=1221500 RepID=A0A165NPY9_9BACL|nr:SET domain-containing protein [Fictibacillus phosphorivorans]KZE67148.1 SET domain-containing protein-lysine N-methyltransferase [Fictibacillus phosphorivorans]
MIEIKKSRYGRGIFATRSIKKGELIHEAPVIVCPDDQYKKLKKTALRDYYFNWGKNYDHVAVALGYGSLFNHSYKPNAKFDNNLKQETVDFYAIKNIKAGEEIFVNYNGDPDDKAPLWFDVY